MIAAKLKLRGADSWGDGSFKASRGLDKNGDVKLHKGIDYACLPGQEIMSPCVGQVTKLGYPYPYTSSGTNYRYVEITDLTGLKHRIFYITPTVDLTQQVTVLDVIGISQDISAKFHDPKRKPMINHVHVEVLGLDGEPINPEGFHE